MHSSVARGGWGGSSPPIGLWSMQNRTFLVLLRPIFCEKLKIAPHFGKQPSLKRLNFRIWSKNQSQFRWRPFFLETTWFWAEKTFEFSSFPRNFVSIFGQTVWNSFKNNKNSGQGRLHFSHSFKVAPPFPNPGYAPVCADSLKLSRVWKW